jgi:hypothetical protein
MITMHGTFDLKDNVAARDFAEAFSAFCAHLQSKGFLTGWQFAERAPHSGYDRMPPETRYYVATDFPDSALAQQCYAYVAADEEPLKSLHKAVNSKVVRETTRFYLVRMIGQGGRQSGDWAL